MTRKSRREKSTKESAKPAMDSSREIPQSQRGWTNGVLLPSIVSSLLLWAAFPPLGLSLVAWIAPLGWLTVIEREAPVGRRGYWALWLSGCIFWLATLQGIRLAFWPLYFGWIALSLYLAVYIPWFVAVARTLRWRRGIPLVFAAPISWVGLELVRSYLITGFSANMLAHTQAAHPIVIQIADQLGAYGVSFLIMTIAAAIRTIAATWKSSQTSRSSTVMAGCTATSMLAAAMGYGYWRLAEADRLFETQEPLLKALLIQENQPTMFESNPNRNQLAWTSYLNMTREAAEQHGEVDLIVWPESTFTANEPWMEANIDAGLPPELAREQIDRSYFEATLERFQRIFNFKVNQVLEAARGQLPGSINQDQTETSEISPPPPSAPYLVLGSDVWIYRSSGIDRFNTALLIGPDGTLLDRYSKMHLVMFGEYIPLGPLLQWLGDSFGMSGIRAGTEVKSFRVNDVRLAPNICFESTMPRLIQHQVKELGSRGESPDLLLNITNDSWFRGSSILDHHLACSILVAVENRRPMLVAGNSGLSAEIDGSGRVKSVSPRLQKEAILASPVRDSRWGLVQTLGYPLGWLCTVAVVLCTVSPLLRPRTR